jgi:WD40 repeat protein
MVALLLCIFLIFNACSRDYQENGMMTIELNFPPDQSPLDGAEGITLSILSGNEQIASQDFPIDSRVGTIEGIPQNIPIRAIVEAKSGDGVTLARGRTPEFILEKNQKKFLRIFFSKPGTFSKLKKDMSARIEPKVALISGDLALVTGGVSPSGLILSSAEVYSHNELSFEVTGAMSHARTGHSVVRLNTGNIAIFGGQDTTSLIPDIEIFNPETRTFNVISRLNLPRKNASVTLTDNGTVLVCGGMGDTSGLNTCETFNPEDSSVKLLEAKMIGFRYNHSSLLLPDSNILLAGGSGFNSVEIFNTQNGSSILQDLLSSERENAYMEFTGQDRIMIACGTKPAKLDFLKLSDYRIHSPEEAPILPADCSAHLMLDGRLFIAGGIENNQPSDSAFIIDLNKFSIDWTGKMYSRRRSPEIQLLSDGTLLILGGTNTPPFAEVFNPP